MLLLVHYAQNYAQNYAGMIGASLHVVEQNITMRQLIKQYSSAIAVGIVPIMKTACHNATSP